MMEREPITRLSGTVFIDKRIRILHYLEHRRHHEGNEAMRMFSFRGAMVAYWTSDPKVAGSSPAGSSFDQLSFCGYRSRVSRFYIPVC